MSQGALAKGVGLTGTFIGLMERGERPIEPRTALAVRYLYEHPEARPLPDDDDEDAWRSPRVYNISQLIALADDASRLYDGRQWGRWRFSADSLSLDLDSEEYVVERDGEEVTERSETYYVMLEEMTSSQRVLDWIGQIASKGWGSPCLGDFVNALDDIFDLQGKFAYGSGYATPDDVRAALTARIEAEQN